MRLRQSYKKQKECFCIKIELKKIFLIKKYLLAVNTLFLIISCSSSDNDTELISHFDGTLKIRSLQDLEDPTIKGYKTINGNLIINYLDEVEDLTALENLEIINGGICIRYNDHLKSLKGLENITELDFLRIEYNPELLSLSGFENLTSIANALIINQNRKLKTLNALSSLTNIGTKFYLTKNDVLTSLNGLENLDTIHQITVLGNINLKCSLANS